MNELQTCPITNLNIEVEPKRGDFLDITVPAADISYRMTGTTRAVLEGWEQLTKKDKPFRSEFRQQLPKLAYLIRRRNTAGERYPNLSDLAPGINADFAQTISELPRPKVTEQIRSYLLWADKICDNNLGRTIDTTYAKDGFNPAGMIAAGVLHTGEYSFFLKELTRKKLLRRAQHGDGERFWLSLNGMQRCEELRERQDRALPW